MATEPIIIIKKKKGHAGHGAHGGAWKVAYADFVTAMMAFFLVMWLLGSDEEIKASIANYFNNPSAPPVAWRPELKNTDSVALGTMTGAGESVLKGAEGNVPEELVRHPDQLRQKDKGREQNETLDYVLDSPELLTLEIMKFSIDEEKLFQENSPDQYTDEGHKILGKLGRLSSQHSGNIAIHASFDPSVENATGPGSYEFESTRANHVRHYLVEHNLAAEERVSIAVSRAPAGAAAQDAGRKIEFTLFKPAPAKE